MERRTATRRRSRSRALLVASLFGLLPLVAAAWTLLLGPPAEGSLRQLAGPLLILVLAAGAAGTLYLPGWRSGLVASAPLALALAVGLLMAALSPAAVAAPAGFAWIVAVPIVGGLSGFGGQRIRGPLRRRLNEPAS